ncbi:MAG TPA: diguanylate cyclase [Candidatus Methylomirabilis sp.]|nr:diguanylate cyclase [Candidatus Methylomirabilis sp.]
MRNRLILGMGVMLLPSVALAVVAFLSLQSAIRAMDSVVQEAIAEQAPVLRLQAAIHGTENAIHDYLIAGESREVSRFEFASQKVDSAFKDVTAAPFELREERALVRTAREEWEAALRAGKTIMASPLPREHVIAKEENDSWDAHIGRATDLLNQFHGLAQQEMAQDLAAAHLVRRRALVIIGWVFALGLGMAILTGTALTRSILLPLQALEEGANRFGAGDLSHRVALVRRDELGHLGETLNAMGEKLADTQKALEDLSNHDALTGLYNYREFHRRLTEEVQRSWRYGRPFSLLILDIDGFKAVNDTYGHLAGDEALRGLAALIRQEARPVDEVARYGGEEFAILLPETPGPGAFAMADRIREIIASHPVSIGPGQTVSLTVSIGVVTYPQDSESEDELIGVADKALYAAKNSGRNRVCQWTTPQTAPSESQVAPSD